jgi:hypothetical protein
MLKGWFWSLKALRCFYQDEAKMITIIKHVGCCIILHNLLIDDVIPDNWKDFTDDELLELALERMWQQTDMFEEEIEMETSQDYDTYIYCF